MNLSNLKSQFPKIEITSAIQCGGNRRAEMQAIKPIKGLSWKGGAIGNAKWGGARLSDVLNGYDLKDVKHVQFEGYDEGSDGSPYGASIPIEKAMSGEYPLPNLNPRNLLLCGTDFGNFMIFLSLRFYVKSILETLKVLKLEFLKFVGL